MTRGKFEPAEFSISRTIDEFTDEMVSFFGDVYKGSWTIDELLLHPREASNFCDEVRRKFGYFYAPDDVILRVILSRRKYPVSD